MLLTLHRLARRLLWARPVSIILVILGLGLTLTSLFGPVDRFGHWLEPSFTLTLWGMMLFAFIQLFQRIPPPVLPHDDFLTRLGSRISLALHSLLALVFLLTTLALFMMSVRLVLHP
jgi:hypothetical protein